MSYLRGNELLMKCRAGRGVVVLVEGETEQDDPFFYNRWFGDRAREVSFFPQNGWQQVCTAVAQVREHMPGRPVFGIIDRDFTDAAVLDRQRKRMPEDGILRTHYYTLENHLLGVSGWHQVIRLIHRDNPPAGWRELVEIEEHLLRCYREFLPVAAYNWVVWQENMGSGKEHPGVPAKEHPDQMRDFDPALLSVLGKSRGSSIDLGLKYQDRLAWLRALSADEWPCWVHGKLLLNRVWLPRIPKAGMNPSHLVNYYIGQCPEPPPALVNLIDQITEAPGRAAFGVPPRFLGHVQ